MKNFKALFLIADLSLNRRRCQSSAELLTRLKALASDSQGLHAKSKTEPDTIELSRLRDAPQFFVPFPFTSTPMGMVFAL
jgi:hypothetical protein